MRILPLYFIKFFLIIITYILLPLSVNAKEINSYSELSDAFNDENSDAILDVQNDLKADCQLGCPKEKSVILNGHNHVIDGDNNSGIVLESGKNLSINSAIINKFHSNSGGVLKTENGSKVGNISGEYNFNSSDTDGGVIFNSSDITKINSNFKSNSSVNSGGVLYNDSDGAVGDINGSFDSNKSEISMGGAICNFGNIKNVKASFNNNSAVEGSGGAIANFSTVESIEGDFENNYAYESGGAIFNSGNIKKLKGNFVSNNTSSTADLSGGGAIINYGYIDKLSGRFENNTSSGRGGAIHNAYGTVNVISDEDDVVFLNNSDSNGSNAIYNDSGVINLNAGDFDIIIEDGISGGNTYEITDSVININPLDVCSENYGNVIINNNVSNNIVNMYSGTLKLGRNIDETASGNFDSTVDFNYYGGIIDLRDNHISNTNLGNLSLFNNMDIKLDGSFEEKIIDTFSVDSLETNGFNINISDIFLMTTTDEKKFSVTPIGDCINDEVKQLLKEAIVYSAGDVINSPVYRYRTSYDSDTGMITFERIEENKYNPSVLAAPVAAQLGGYLTQLNSYEEVFRKMDLYMLENEFSRQSYKYKNLYAQSDTNEVLKSQIYRYDKKYGWLRPYSIFERVPLKNGPKVSNVAYGSFFGVESETIQLKNGYNLIWGPYFGYNGSHQAYNGVKIYQNGGTLGALAFLYSDNFFLVATSNVSSNGCIANNMYGSESFAMLMSGIALKTGYNFKFSDSKYLIQPNYLMSYTYVNTYPYKNSANVRIDSSALNAIQISPGIQFAVNLNGGWQPYVNAYMVWNLIDKTNFKANDISLPNLSIKPFVLYGAGIRKNWSERFFGFTQTYVTNGGRNGAGFNFGFRFAI